jgi:hypothetical protein
MSADRRRRIMRINKLGLAGALTLGAALLVLLTGCEPAEGQKCNTPGEFYTHVDDRGHRVSLRCEPGGIDTSGRGQREYRWVKA